MKVAKAQFTGKSWKTNEDTWGDLDTWERRDHELIRGYLNDASEEFENESWKLRMNNSEMMGYGESIWKDSWIAPDGWKEFKRAMNLREKGQDLEETLLRSSNVENEDENHHDNLWDTPEQRRIEMLNQRWKCFKSDLEEGIWLMIIHSYVKLGKEFGNSSGKIRRVR